MEYENLEGDMKIKRDENKKIDFIKDLKQVIKRYNEICQ